MNQQLAKSTQIVQEALHKAGLQCKILEFTSSTRTSIDAAKNVGCDLAQIAKTLVFKTKNTANPILIIASGANRVDEKQIAHYVGEEIIKADAHFTRQITGFAIGGIPPIGHTHHIDLVFIDQDLLAFDEVWSAAGTPNTIFCIKVKDLLSITKAKVISIC